jgi:hypothetical protein
MDRLIFNRLPNIWRRLRMRLLPNDSTVVLLTLKSGHDPRRQAPDATPQA